MFKVFVVFLLTVVGFQAIAVDADFNGEYRFRVESTSSTGDDVIDNLGSSLSSDIRAKVSGSFRPSESFEGVTALYLNLDDESRSLADQMVAYGDWMISDEFMLRAGQSTYKIADGSVLGINDYDAVPSLFKGLFFTHSSENVGLDVALVENKDFDDLFIVSVDARSFPDVVKTANFHLIVKDVRRRLGFERVENVMVNPAPAISGINMVASEAAAVVEQAVAVEQAAVQEDGNNSEGVYLGTTLGGGAEGFGYRVTASTDSLTNILSVSNLLVDGKISYSFELDNSSIKAFVGGHKDGADYDVLLYEKHFNAGKMDLADWGNGLTYAYGGLAYKTSSDWKLGLKGYYFIDNNGKNKVAEGDVEVDVYLKKAFNSSVSGKIWAGALIPKVESNVDLKAQAVIQMKF